MSRARVRPRASSPPLAATPSPRPLVHCQSTKPTSFYSLPYELRLIIYEHLVADLLAQYDSEQLGSIFTYTGSFKSAHFRRTHVRPRERRNLWFLKVCRCSAFVGRELWSLLFARAVPELVCSGRRVADVLAGVRDGALLDEAAASHAILAESLSRFDHLKLSLLCDAGLDGADFLEFIYRRRDPGRRIGLHVALEDLVVAVHGPDWFFNAPCAPAAGLRALLWDPRVALFVFAGMTREPTWSWTYWNGAKMTDRLVRATCAELGIDRARVLESYRPELMRFGSAWQMERLPSAAADC